MTRWVYNEDDIPDGWTVEPTSIKDDFGTLKDWAQKCDRLIDRGTPAPSIHSPIFDTFASYDDSSDGSTTDDDRKIRPPLPDHVEGASIIERRSGDRANRYGHNW